LFVLVLRHRIRFTLARLLAMLTEPRGGRGAGSQRSRK
jgi:hypothetical protein